MIQRGKFRSLTLINWNGFFARTFDLDELVTTLSGGNGAGKSTTMAAFVTALIPDLTLLHFRNTTEAGATTGSRDRGLHGKLKAGVCYSLLDVVNSRNQRVIAGVRLQQVAGRDKKVDIKPFVIQGLAISANATELVTERLNDRQARILTLQELKDKLEATEGVIFKQFNAITDYHAVMFDLGLLPRRLRSSSDRSKFYRLIEASLYGGISSAITRSLRDYLLPENSGVRKAFQDMESALRENRMTLEAIRVTQSDRDLFKHLITESTQYVAADYMRHANERRVFVEQALGLRGELLQSKKQQVHQQQKQIEIARELHELTEQERDLEIDFQSANDHLSLVQTALRHQEKIERYQQDIEEIRYRLEEQQEIVAENKEQYSELEAIATESETEVDDLKTQLADYQQALDSQQTRVIQYQQAVNALNRAKEVLNQPNLTVNDAETHLKDAEQILQSLTQQTIQFEQKMRLANASQDSFTQALNLVTAVHGAVARDEAYNIATQLLQEAVTQRHLAEQLPQLRARINELQQRLQQQHDASKQLQEFNRRYQQDLSAESLAEYYAECEARIESLAERVESAGEERLALRQQQEQINTQIALLRAQAPAWLAAQDALQTLTQQSQTAFSASEELTEYMQHLLDKERELSSERDKVDIQRIKLDDEITALSQVNGVDEQQLLVLAERFGGVLLSEIYEDISIEDAPYFSALYGPARHAIVVPELAKIRPLLDDLTDCPDDLYLIEGDPNAFDDSVFNVEEQTRSVLVKSDDKQWRYSRFPSVPLFGTAAREKRLEELRVLRDELAERYAVISFDLQKSGRVLQAFSQFVGAHLAVAFLPDPEAAIHTLQQQLNQIERQIASHTEANQQQRTDFDRFREQLNALNRLLPLCDLISDDSIVDRYEELKAQEEEAQEAKQYLLQHGENLTKLQSIASALQADPEQFEAEKARYEEIVEQQKIAEERAFVLRDLMQRKAYFAYADLIASGQEEDSDQQTLVVKLRERLTIAEQTRQDSRERLRQYQTQFTQAQQAFAALKSSFDTKHELLKELEQEQLAFGIRADEGTEERSRVRRDELQLTLNSTRQQRQQLERQIVTCEAELENLQKKLRNDEKEYQRVRSQVVSTKLGWCAVMRLVKSQNVEKRLHRRDFAYLNADELRSMSDKALGSLRLAVANNEHLRDVLRASEDPKHPERKIQFYLAVYQHLRERIRQDIIHTDDPIDAIEQMEIELGRLTEELNSREKTLSISSHAVANIIRKTIQREQSRIRQLNQGLQSVAFGQVQSVRLNVNIRESHALLLDALGEDSPQHQDLFQNQRYTFSEALAKLYQRLHPQIDLGQKAPQTLGEELLDYRNYLDMEVEIFRGTDGWLRAESGALSTGEAIGTGMSILVMVVQSWEDESLRMRGKDILPCRLLFLDEAARLDAKSIATLFELCERLDMQLVIAAPENISPEKGTTYKLMRKVYQNSEYVHVVGLKGFAENSAPQ